jgi:hypothetical protein
MAKMPSEKEEEDKFDMFDDPREQMMPRKKTASVLLCP